MKIGAFRNYVRYSTERPERIHPGRWSGMLRWSRRDTLPCTNFEMGIRCDCPDCSFLVDQFIKIAKAI